MDGVTAYDDEVLRQIGSAALVAEKFHGDGTGAAAARSVLDSLEVRGALGEPGEVDRLRAEVERLRDLAGRMAPLDLDGILALCASVARDEPGDPRSTGTKHKLATETLPALIRKLKEV